MGRCWHAYETAICNFNSRGLSWRPKQRVWISLEVRYSLVLLTVTSGPNATGYVRSRICTVSLCMYPVSRVKLSSKRNAHVAGQAAVRGVSVVAMEAAFSWQGMHGWQLFQLPQFGALRSTDLRT